MPIDDRNIPAWREWLVTRGTDDASIVETWAGGNVPVDYTGCSAVLTITDLFGNVALTLTSIPSANGGIAFGSAPLGTQGKIAVLLTKLGSSVGVLGLARYRYALVVTFADGSNKAPVAGYLILS